MCFCATLVIQTVASLSLDFLVMKFEFLWAELFPLSTKPWGLSLLKYCKLLFTLHSFFQVFTIASVEFLCNGLAKTVSAEGSVKSKNVNNNTCVPEVAVLFYFFAVYSATETGSISVSILSCVQSPANTAKQLYLPSLPIQCFEIGYLVCLQKMIS